MKEFFVLDDFDLKNKRVAIRIDLNSDFENGKLLPNERFEAYSKTVKELIEREAKVIILAHQSRKGEPDFVSLNQHAELFSKYVGYNIEFVNDIIGEKAKKRINELKSGEAIMLDNVRFLDDEDKEKSINEHANSSLVKFLSPLIDFYVLDAFSAAHRSHASIVGFATVKPMIAGRVMEKEIESVKEAIKPLGLNVWIVGGAKIDDCIKVLEKMFERKPESIEKVLTGGLLAALFLLAKGYKIGKTYELLEKKGYLNLLEKAKKLLSLYSKEILEEVAKSDAYSLIGGGDTSVAIEKFKIPKNKFNYISVGGGALITYLAEGTLVGIEALKISYSLFRKPK